MGIFKYFKKIDRRYNVMVVPSDGSGTKSYNLHHNTIRRFLFFVIFFVVIFAGWTAFMGLKPDFSTQNFNLMRKNVKLENELLAVQSKLAILENTIDRIERFDRKLRVMTDFADHRRRVGIGPLSEEEILATQKTGQSGVNEALALKIKEKIGMLSSADLGMEVNRLLESAAEREKELAELTNFLEDQKLLLSHIPSIWPSDGWVTSGFGYRRSPFTNVKKFHEGIDIANNIGTKIMTPADGTVIYTGNRDGYGKTLVINHGFGLTTRYAHCSRFLVKVGQKVKRGDSIATVGNTGRSTGPHLHYEVRFNNIPQNPKRYILQ